MSSRLTFCKGHERQGGVTCLQVGSLKNDKGEEVEFLVSGGRDNKVITWDLHERKSTDDDPEWGTKRKVLHGHSHFVQDLSLSLDSKYALSASWDKTIRLWDLQRGETVETFVDHSKDVLTCSLSADNKLIASGGRDKDIKIWNTKGQCKYTVDDDKHSDWVSCLRFSPDTKTPILASGSWDGQIKIFDPSTMALKHTFVGHTNAVTSLAFAQKAMYLASGGKDGNILLWNVEAGDFIKSYNHSAPINQVLFSKINYWIAAATDSGIIFWDIVKEQVIAEAQVFKGQDEKEDDEDKKDEPKLTVKTPIACLSIAWSKNGTMLYSGWSDNKIRVYETVNQTN